jgi:hypothetical protein
LSKDDNVKLVIVHQPNKSSGGRSSQTSVEVFLAQGGQGPEHQGLVRELTSLSLMDANKGDRELSTEEAERLARALGEAVSRCWSSLPQEIQHNLFEAAVRSEGEIIRQQLALYLHEKHARTLAAIQAKAMPSPDSLAG